MYDNSDMASEPVIRHSCKCLAGSPPLSTHTGQSRVIFECSTTTTTYCYSKDCLNIEGNIYSYHINYVADSILQTKNFSDARSPETKSPTWIHHYLYFCTSKQVLLYQHEAPESRSCRSRAWANLYSSSLSLVGVYYQVLSPRQYWDNMCQQIVEDGTFVLVKQVL